MSGPTGPAPHDVSRRAWLSAGAPILGLVTLVIVLAVLVFVGFAREQDRNFSDSTRRLVISALDGRLTSLANTTLDFSNWDDAFHATTTSWDQAWLDNNFYSSVADGLIVFGANGAVRYSWFADPEQNPDGVLERATRNAALTIPSMTRLSRAATAEETVAHTLTSIDGRLALVALAPVSLEEDEARLARDPSAPVNYIAMIEMLEADEIAAIGASLDLHDLAFVGAQGRVSNGPAVDYVVRAGRGHEIGKLQWRHEQPGSAVLLGQLGMVVFGLLMIGALTLWVTRRLVARQVASMAHAEAALESSRVKSEFISTMSHELRTPLNAIIGYSEMIEEEMESGAPVTATISQDAGRILAAARHLSQMVNDILDQSRIDAGRLPLNFEPLLVADVLTEVHEVMAPSAEAKGVRFAVAADSAPLRVFADHQRLRQCLVNLAGNAIKFTGAGLVSLRARSELHDGRVFVVIDVADTGPGIAAHELDLIFAPFVQGASPKQFGGSGLGLSISRKLARAMGGDIKVQSEPGKGSTFSLSLPAASALAIVEAA